MPTAAHDRFPNAVPCVGPRSGLCYERLGQRHTRAAAALVREAFPTTDPEHLHDEESLALQVAAFPDGAFVGIHDGEPVALGIGVRAAFDLARPQHRMMRLYDGDPSGHDPAGDWYYGTDICVDRRHRGRGIGSELYDLRKAVVVRLGLRGIVAGSVMPGYAQHRSDLTPEDYVAAVRDGRLYDPTLSFQLSQGFEARCVLHDYLDDPATGGAAALIVWTPPGEPSS